MYNTQPRCGALPLPCAGDFRARAASPRFHEPPHNEFVALVFLSARRCEIYPKEVIPSRVSRSLPQIAPKWGHLCLKTQQ